MANRQFGKLFHSLLASSAFQILSFPSLTHCLNTATITTFKLLLTQYLPWGLLRTCWRRQEQCSVGPDAETISRLLLSKGTWFIIYSLNCLRNGTYGQGDDRSQPVLLGQEYHEPTSCRGPVGNANSVHGCEIMWRSFFFFNVHKADFLNSL